jgi:hypothetical protein
MDCLRAQGECELFPEPPETVKAIAKAGDRRTALNQSFPNGSFGILPYEVEALVERGELVSRSRRMASQESLVLANLLPMERHRIYRIVGGVARAA